VDVEIVVGPGSFRGTRAPGAVRNGSHGACQARRVMQEDNRRTDGKGVCRAGAMDQNSGQAPPVRRFRRGWNHRSRRSRVAGNVDAGDEPIAQSHRKEPPSSHSARSSMTCGGRCAFATGWFVDACCMGRHVLSIFVHALRVWGVDEPDVSPRSARAQPSNARDGKTRGKSERSRPAAPRQLVVYLAASTASTRRSMRGRHAAHSPRAPPPGQLDRRQGIDDSRSTSRLPTTTRARRAPRSCSPGAVLPGHYCCMYRTPSTTASRADPGRPDEKRMQDLAKQTGMSARAMV